MTISKLNKIVSIITSVFITVFFGIFASCFAHICHTWINGDDLVLRINEYLEYLILPGILALVFVVIKIVVELILKSASQHSAEKTNREILDIYRMGYYFDLLDRKTASEFERIVKRRDLVDLIGCQIASLCFVLAFDYLIFFANFSRESVAADLNVALLIVLTLFVLGIAVFIARHLYSEAQTKKAIKIITQDKSQRNRVVALNKICTSPAFLKFKRRKTTMRVVKAVISGLSSGLLAFGVILLLCKFAIIDFEILIPICVGMVLALAVGGLTFAFDAFSDKDFAEELDELFDLKARVQTMVEYNGDEGEVVSLQREDTEGALSNIPLKAYKFKKIWIHITALVLASAIFTTGFVVEDRRNIIPPEEIVPFELSDVQRSGLLELIKSVEKSEMEDEFKTPLVNELNALLAKLENIHTEPDMQITLAESMAIITSITYDSSTATEMLNALWDSKDVNLRHLAKVLDTSSWNSPDWGDFAEKLIDFIIILTGEEDKSEGATVGTERIKWSLDSMNTKIDIVLKNSGLSEDDKMYVAVDDLFHRPIVGFEEMIAQLDGMSDEDARALLENSLNIMSEDVYAAISQNRVNAVTGEYAMTRLAALFLVPVPEFERPEFVKTGEPADPNNGDVGNNNDKGQTGPGGVGKGESFGSDDEILDPQTGKYVKYGDLIHTYYTIMFEKLQSDSYTEEQKEAIVKYFELLYGGLEEEK